MAVPDQTYVEPRPLPGRGIGLVAKRSIPAGQLLFTEAPLLNMTEDVLAQLDTLEGRKIAASAIARALAALPKEAQRSYFLSNCFPTAAGSGRPDMPAMLGIWCTNAMSSTPGQSSVYPFLARANHSCQPNAAYSPSRSPTDATMQLRAVRAIEEGEEVTIAYCETTLPRDQRRLYLDRQYSFTCVCPACEVPDEVAKAADVEWQRFAKAKLVLAKWADGKADGQLALEAALLRLDTLKRHHRYMQRAVAWADLARIAASHSSTELTERYSANAAEAFAIEIGPEHELATKHRAWSDEAETHPQWAKRAKRDLRAPVQ